MRNLLFVGAGGFLGSICRYLLGGAVHQLLHNSTFPYGTVVVNMFGCFLVGFFSGLAEVRQLLTPESRLFLLIGLLGGFTTFSTFGYETVALMREGEVLAALSNVLIQVNFGLLFVWIGFNSIRIPLG